MGIVIPLKLCINAQINDFIYIENFNFSSSLSDFVRWQHGTMAVARNSLMMPTCDSFEKLLVISVVMFDKRL